MTRRSLVAVVAMAIATLLALVRPIDAWALDRTFAGSAQIDYMLVPTAREANARFLGFDGFKLEATTKLTVDFSERFSANVKGCYGCHGFEMDMAYFDYRVADALSFRFGRFSPSFGSFNIRHDPANHRLVDKPLAYDMGRMLRMRSWNLGVLPSPFPDNGVEISGSIALAARAAALPRHASVMRSEQIFLPPSSEQTAVASPVNSSPSTSGSMEVRIARAGMLAVTSSTTGVYSSSSSREEATPMRFIVQTRVSGVALGSSGGFQRSRRSFSRRAMTPEAVA